MNYPDEYWRRVDRDEAYGHAPPPAGNGAATELDDPRGASPDMMWGVLPTTPA